MEFCFDYSNILFILSLQTFQAPPRTTDQSYLNLVSNTISGIILQAFKLAIMNAISRFFDLMTTVFFILWMLLRLFESYDLSVFCLAAVLFFAVCMAGFRLFIFYKITLHRLKQ